MTLKSLSVVILGYRDAGPKYHIHAPLAFLVIYAASYDVAYSEETKDRFRASECF